MLISDDGQALLADFGFSFIVNSSFSMNVPNEDKTKGTINWMSPQSIEDGKVSVEADVWAFGMTALVCSSSFHFIKLKKIHTGTVHA